MLSQIAMKHVYEARTLDKSCNDTWCVFDRERKEYMLYGAAVGFVRVQTGYVKKHKAGKPKKLQHVR